MKRGVGHQIEGRRVFALFYVLYAFAGSFQLPSAGVMVLGFYHSGDNEVLENIRGGNALHGGGNRTKHTKRTSDEETTFVRVEKKKEVKEKKKGKEGVEDSDKDTGDNKKPGTERTTSHSNRRDHTPGRARLELRGSFTSSSLRTPSLLLRREALWRLSESLI